MIFSLINRMISNERFISLEPFAVRVRFIVTLLDLYSIFMNEEQSLLLGDEQLF